MIFNPHFPLAITTELSAMLNSLGRFVYLPAPGNADNSLTAAATVLLFERMGLDFEFFDKQKDYGPGCTLVYGGGNTFIPDREHSRQLRKIFSSPHIKRCVILPQSIRNCPALQEVVDERFTVFLRDKESYDYALAHHNSTRAQFILAHDMAFCLDPAQFMEKLISLNLLLPPPSLLTYRIACCRQHLLRQHGTGITRTITRYRLNNLRNKVNQQVSQSLQRLPDGRKLAWMMRTDEEKATYLSPPEGCNVELSGIHNSTCCNEEENLLTTFIFLEALQQADIIITDQLHVSIGAAFMGKHVIVRNDRCGSLSGAWELSPLHTPKVCVCQTDNEVQAVLHRHSHSQTSLSA